MDRFALWIQYRIRLGPLIECVYRMMRGRELIRV